MRCLEVNVEAWADMEFAAVTENQPLKWGDAWIGLSGQIARCLNEERVCFQLPMLKDFAGFDAFVINCRLP